MESDFAAFEWDDDKRADNLRRARGDFSDFPPLLLQPRRTAAAPSRGNDPWIKPEERWLAVLRSGEDIVSVIYTVREKTESSRHDRRAKMNEKRITRISADDVRKLGRGKTDWKRIRNMTDEEIEAAARSDPDWAGFMDVDWSKAVVVVPKKKKAISIRLDDDVVDFFKAQGEGYQTRMNAVLRHYMNSTKKPDAAE